MFKKALLAAIMSVASVGAASAAPINGSFSVVSFGGTYVTGSNYTSTGATSMNATGLDFGNAFTSTGNGFGVNGTTLVGNTMGSFVGLEGKFASISDILLSTTASPYTTNPFISFGTDSNIVISFNDATITRNVDDTGVRVYGAATFSDGIAADTSIGTFNITTSTQTNNGALTVNFTMTGNSGATAVPEPVSLSLLGASLIGMGAIRMRRKA